MTGVQTCALPIWGSQRIWTKGLPKDFGRKSVPVHIAYGEPLIFTKENNLEEAETQLRNKMIEMLHKLQEKYPDSHVGERWAPQRLGGTAPAPIA